MSDLDELARAADVPSTPKKLRQLVWGDRNSAISDAADFGVWFGLTATTTFILGTWILLRVFVAMGNSEAFTEFMRSK